MREHQLRFFDSLVLLCVVPTQSKLEFRGFYLKLEMRLLHLARCGRLAPQTFGAALQPPELALQFRATAEALPSIQEPPLPERV